MIIDVSSYQGKIDWKAVSKTGVEGVILRSTTKNGKLDTRLIENYNGILQNMNDTLNMLSFYKFSYARNFEDAAVECLKTLCTLADAGIRKEAFDTFYLDLEAWDGRDYTTKEASAVLLAYTYICDKLDVKLGLYSNYNYLKNIIDPVWAGLPLWYARYNTYMGNIEPWKPEIWQYSDKGQIDGIKGNVDINKRVNV